MEDSATPGSDMSAISGMREAVHWIAFSFVIEMRTASLLETKAINPGVWGRAPGLLGLIRLINGSGYTPVNMYW